MVLGGRVGLDGGDLPCGVWVVRTGDEDAWFGVDGFRDRASTMPGSGTLRLVRGLDNPGRYMSLAPWESNEAQVAWKQLPEFRERIGRVRGHGGHFEPSVLELVVEVE